MGTTDQANEIYRVAQGDVEFTFKLPRADDDHIQGHLARTNEFYERVMLEHAASRIKAGDCVVDIGACIGNHSVFFAGIAGAQVDAFEPNPEALELLRANVELNDLGDLVTIHAAGLGSQEESARAEKVHEDNLGSARLVVGAEGDLTVRRLDDVELSGPPALIKVDVEGMELDVLLGGERTIREAQPLIYVECATRGQLTEVLELLVSWGFVPVAHFNATPTLFFCHAGDASLPFLHEHLAYFSWSTDRNFARLVGGQRKIKSGLTQSTTDIQARIDAGTSQTSDSIAALCDSMRASTDAAERRASALAHRLEIQNVRLQRIEQELHTLKMRARHAPAPSPNAAPRAPVSDSPTPQPRWRKKLTKLQRDPEAFVADISSPGQQSVARVALRAVGPLVEASSGLKTARRKLRKLQRDPEAFFGDAKAPLVRGPIARAFGVVVDESEPKSR